MNALPSQDEGILRVFLDYLSVEKGLSSNTLQSYRLDLAKLFFFLLKDQSYLK